MAEGQLDCTIAEEFPGAYAELRRDFNQAVATLAATIGAVRASAGSVLNAAGEIRAAVHIHQHMPPKRAQHLATAHGETMEHIGRLADLHQLRVNLRAANDTHVTLGPDRTTLAAGVRRSLRETKIRYNSLPSARSPAVGIPPCARATRPICSIAWEANKTPAGEVSSPAARKASNVQVLQV